MYLSTEYWWLVAKNTPGSAGYGMMAQRILGDFAWRKASEVRGGACDTAPSRLTGDGFAKVRRWGDFILRNWSRKPIPRGAATFKAVDLSSAASLALDAAFDAKTASVSGVPVSLAVRDGKVSATEAVAEGVEFPLGRKAASLCILHAATVPEKMKERFYSKKNGFRDPLGPVIAEWKVTYSDGTSEAAPIRLGWNVGEYRSRPALVCVFDRYPADCRAIMTGALPKPEDPSAPDTGVASLHEWVNPHPEKEIVSLALIRKDPVARYAALAVSARDVTDR